METRPHLLVLSTIYTCTLLAPNIFRKPGPAHVVVQVLPADNSVSSERFESETGKLQAYTLSTLCVLPCRIWYQTSYVKLISEH